MAGGSWPKSCVKVAVALQPNERGSIPGPATGGRRGLMALLARLSVF